MESVVMKMQKPLGMASNYKRHSKRLVKTRVTATRWQPRTITLHWKTSCLEYSRSGELSRTEAIGTWKRERQWFVVLTAHIFMIFLFLEKRTGTHVHTHTQQNLISYTLNVTLRLPHSEFEVFQAWVGCSSGGPHSSVPVNVGFINCLSTSQG